LPPYALTLYIESIPAFLNLSSKIGNVNARPYQTFSQIVIPGYAEVFQEDKHIQPEFGEAFA
jgi:hypothetical protein